MNKPHLRNSVCAAGSRWRHFIRCSFSQELVITVRSNSWIAVSSPFPLLAGFRPPCLPKNPIVADLHRGHSLFRSWSPAIQSLCDVVWIRAPALRRACYALVAVWCAWGPKARSWNTHTLNFVEGIAKGGFESHIITHVTNGNQLPHSLQPHLHFADPMVGLLECSKWCQVHVHRLPLRAGEGRCRVLLGKLRANLLIGTVTWWILECLHLPHSRESKCIQWARRAPEFLKRHGGG